MLLIGCLTVSAQSFSDEYPYEALRSIIVENYEYLKDGVDKDGSKYTSYYIGNIGDYTFIIADVYKNKKTIEYCYYCKDESVVSKKYCDKEKMVIKHFPINNISFGPYAITAFDSKVNIHFSKHYLSEYGYYFLFVKTEYK